MYNSLTDVNYNNKYEITGITKLYCEILTTQVNRFVSLTNMEGSLTDIYKSYHGKSVTP